MTNIIFTSIIILILGTGSFLQAQDSASRLKASMASERVTLLEAVVKGWREQQDEEEIGKIITRLLDVQVRLQAIDAAAANDLVSSVLTHADASKTRSIQELAAEIAHSYYREQGLTVNTRACFASVYYLWPAKVE